MYFSLIFSREYGGRTWDAIPAIDIALGAIKDQQLLPACNLTYDDKSESDSKVFKRGTVDFNYTYNTLILPHRNIHGITNSAVIQECK